MGLIKAKEFHQVCDQNRNIMGHSGNQNKVGAKKRVSKFRNGALDTSGMGLRPSQRISSGQRGEHGGFQQRSDPARGWKGFDG